MASVLIHPPARFGLASILLILVLGGPLAVPAATDGGIFPRCLPPSLGSTVGIPQTASLPFHHQTLAQALAELHATQGLAFSISPEIGADPLPPATEAENRRQSLPTLLAPYNHMAISDGSGKIQRVIVSSRKTGTPLSASSPSIAEWQESSLNLLYYQDEDAELPEPYRDSPLGSVSRIDLPVEGLGEMTPGQSLGLDLPAGYFKVIYEARAEHPDGGQTWYGHLDGEYRDYWVMLELGADASVGRIETPGGLYRIESAQGRTWLIEAH